MKNKKRGRPKGSKNKKETIEMATEIKPSPSLESVNEFQFKADDIISNEPIKNEPPKNEISEETRQEAKLLIKGFFEFGAAILDEPDFNLLESELEGISPSWAKVFHDYIKPKIEGDMNLYLFFIMFMGLMAKRVKLIKKGVSKFANFKFKESPKSNGNFSHYRTQGSGQVAPLETPKPPNEMPASSHF